MLILTKGSAGFIHWNLLQPVYSPNRPVHNGSWKQQGPCEHLASTSKGFKESALCSQSYTRIFCHQYRILSVMDSNNMNVSTRLDEGALASMLLTCQVSASTSITVTTYAEWTTVRTTAQVQLVLSPELLTTKTWAFLRLNTLLTCKHTWNSTISCSHMASILLPCGFSEDRNIQYSFLVTSWTPKSLGLCEGTGVLAAVLRT